ncbi:hypothetical protein HRbin30_01978 [bacterium HR30]|nr:hypothetical protein HRbin30_01978 [bacterium HR30]
MLDGLEAADGASELLADLGVGHAHLQDFFHAAAHFGAKPHLGSVSNALEQRPTGMLGSH